MKQLECKHGVISVCFINQFDYLGCEGGSESVVLSGLGLATFFVVLEIFDGFGSFLEALIEFFLSLSV